MPRKTAWDVLFYAYLRRSPDFLPDADFLRSLAESSWLELI
jgi:hypothetical protein